jgi:hypothetical protein
MQVEGGGKFGAAGDFHRLWGSRVLVEACGWNSSSFLLRAEGIVKVYSFGYKL